MISAVVETPACTARGQHVSSGTSSFKPTAARSILRRPSDVRGRFRVVLVRARERSRSSAMACRTTRRRIGSSGGRGLAVGGTGRGPSHDRHEGRADVRALAGGFAREGAGGQSGPARASRPRRGCAGDRRRRESSSRTLTVSLRMGCRMFADDARLERGIFDGEERLDPPPEVARHPVGAGEEDLGVAAVLEVENAAVLEVLVHDARDPDGLRHARQPGTQTADTRTTSSMATPACDARYNASMTDGSTKAFISR